MMDAAAPVLARDAGLSNLRIVSRTAARIRCGLCCWLLDIDAFPINRKRRDVGRDEEEGRGAEMGISFFLCFGDGR